MFTHESRFTKPVRYGVPVRPDWVSSKFRQFRKGAALPALRLQGLPHTVATVAYEQGETSRTIADLLGHADQSVTDRTYMDTVQRLQDAAAARVASAISSARGGGA